ncbi:MAG: hypothetical protein ACRDKW_06185 [Actinomycetota bacterium]
MAAPAAYAAPESLVWCYGTWTVAFSQGIAAAPQTSAFETHGRVVNYIGEIGGEQVTGPGTFTHGGLLSGTTLGGTGSGTQVIDVPTSGGRQQLPVKGVVPTLPPEGGPDTCSLCGRWTTRPCVPFNLWGFLE